MPDSYYREAMRLGQKDAAKNGADAMPVLDELLEPNKLLSGVDLGIVQVPIERIVGIKSRGRVNAFAPNFMPILEEGTEFSAKWSRLCEAHLEEGIRDPIEAWEYLNRFYVAEGNKRVSVLKFFGAVNVQAHVTRILPERDGSRESELYYEFAAFYKLSRVNFIELTRKGGYAALQTLLGKESDESWTEDERRHFASDYHYFTQAYLAAGGEKLSSTPGDALLSYLEVYGYPALRRTSVVEIKRNLLKMWEEVALRQDEAPIEIKLKPADEKKPGLLSRVLPGDSSPLKVGFLYDKSPEESGWTLGHEFGRHHVQRVFAGRIQTVAYSHVMDSDPLAVIEQAVNEGCRMLFTTSPRLMQASLRAAVEHPEVVIMNCSLNLSHRYVRSYYARMYEAKFIIGAIAGSLTESGRLGYVCDYPIFGQIAGINAFALGAQMTNPRAEVYLEWSSVKPPQQCISDLTARGIHHISSQETAQLAKGRRSSFGLSCLHDDGTTELLAWPVWRWGVYYEQILRRMLDHTVRAEYQSSSKALNYYWGMSAGVVDVRFANTLQEGTRRLAEFLKESICREVCSPFLTPLRTQSGELVGVGERVLAQDQIIAMDYLVENVLGSIPAYDALNPTGKATVDSAGVWQATKNAAEAEQESERDENSGRIG